MSLPALIAELRHCVDFSRWLCKIWWLWGKALEILCHEWALMSVSRILNQSLFSLQACRLCWQATHLIKIEKIMFGCMDRYFLASCTSWTIFFLRNPCHKIKLLIPHLLPVVTWSVKLFFPHIFVMVSFCLWSAECINVVSCLVCVGGWEKLHLVTSASY